MSLSISSSPSDEEVAAIMSAMEALWPRTVYVEAAPEVRVPTWRFSNRWWIAPLPTRRERPRR